MEDKNVIRRLSFHSLTKGSVMKHKEIAIFGDFTMETLNYTIVCRRDCLPFVLSNFSAVPGPFNESMTE